jgi:hypothetical protein
MPDSGAQMGVLVAEEFEPQLVKAITDGMVVRPEHGVWLVEATGFIVGGTPIVTYTLRASSLPPEQGGLHIWANVRPTHPRCNRKKRDRFPTTRQLRRAGFDVEEPLELFDSTPYDAYVWPPAV